LTSPAVTRRVLFSPQQGSQTSADAPLPPSPVASTRHSTAAQASRSSTSARSPRTPRTPTASTPTRPPQKNGKPSGNLLNHLVKPNLCPSVPRDVQTALRPVPAPAPAPTADPDVEPASRGIDQDAFDLALARVFFVCALPFILVEAQVFRDFIALVAPAVKIPSRHKLSMMLLKRVRDEIRLKVIQMISAHTYVSLVTDGWTDTNGSSIINFMVVAPGLPSLFWSSWSTRSKKHTARYLAGDIDKVIEEVEQETTAQVVGVVTDNAKNMRSATSQVQSRRPHVISGGCSAHVLNLLMQDIGQFPVIKAVLSRAVALTRFVRDHLALYDEFKQLQQGVRDAGTKARNLVLPVPTRWYSVHACLRNVLNSRETLEKLFLNPDYEQFMDRYRGTASNRKKLIYVIALVRDDVFWNTLRTVVRLFDPVIEALRALEADNGFVSGVYRWLRYHTVYGVTSPEPEPEYSESENESDESDSEALDSTQQHDIGVLSDAAAIVGPTAPAGDGVAVGGCSQVDGAYKNLANVRLNHLQGLFREKIQKRWRYVHTNAMAVAFLLDPSMSIDDFVGSDDDQVDDQVCKLAERCGLISSTGVAALTAEILSFKCLKRRGGEALRAKYSESSPRDYWGSQSEKKYPLLKKLDDIVFAIPTSSAASERACSIFDHIHSKRRNRLSVEKVEMLAFVYINYGALRKDELDLARHQSCPESVDKQS